MQDELKKKLIDNSSEIQVMMEEDRIAEDILGRFNNMKLVDKYEAYEIFKNEYDSISGDLELIQGEGKEAVRQVDPNMVIKKKNGKDTEVSEKKIEFDTNMVYTITVERGMILWIRTIFQHAKSS